MTQGFVFRVLKHVWVFRISLRCFWHDLEHLGEPGEVWSSAQVFRVQGQGWDESGVCYVMLSVDMPMDAMYVDGCLAM